MNFNECQFRDTLKDFIDKVIKTCNTHLELVTQVSELKNLGEYLKTQMMSHVPVTTCSVETMTEKLDSVNNEDLCETRSESAVNANKSGGGKNLVAHSSGSIDAIFARSGSDVNVDKDEKTFSRRQSISRSLRSSGSLSASKIDTKTRPCSLPSPMGDSDIERKVKTLEEEGDGTSITEEKEHLLLITHEKKSWSYLETSTSHDCCINIGGREESKSEKFTTKSLRKRRSKRRKLDALYNSSSDSSEATHSEREYTARSMQKGELRSCVVMLNRLPRNIVGKYISLDELDSSSDGSDKEFEKIYKMRLRSFKDVKSFCRRSEHDVVKKTPSKSGQDSSSLQSEFDSESEVDSTMRSECAGAVVGGEDKAEHLAREKLDLQFQNLMSNCQSDYEDAESKSPLKLLKNSAENELCCKKKNYSEQPFRKKIEPLTTIKLSTSEAGVSNSSDDEIIRKRTSKGRKRYCASSSSDTNSSNESAVTVVAKRSKDKLESNSHASFDSNESDFFPSFKRKKVKKFFSESDPDEGVLMEEEPCPDDALKGKATRKNIRAIIKDSKVAPETKDALQAEEERRKRIALKQKEYNDVLLPRAEETGSTPNPKQSRIVLDYDQKSKQAIVEVDPLLVKLMKPHQIEGVRFMWDCCYESVERIKSDRGGGCILSHCMGLGKTFQVIALLHTLMRYQEITDTRRCLIVVPKNTLLNWKSEFKRWQKNLKFQVEVFEMSHIKPHNLRLEYICNWHRSGGVFIMSYAQYRRLSAGIGIRKKQLKESVVNALLNPGPDVVVCDEGHVLKNHSSALSKAMNKIETRRRIVLTGTPLQNNLVEYHCMVSFVKPNLLGTFREFKNRFANPILNGLLADSTLTDVKVMKRRAHVLHDMLDGCVQRKDYQSLRQYLPPKYEYVVSTRLSNTQRLLYKFFLENVSKDEKLASKILMDFHCLNRVWSHPYLLFMHKMREDLKQVDESTGCSSDYSSTSSADDASVIAEDDAREKEDITAKTLQEMKSDNSNMWWTSFLPEESKFDILLSGKIVLLLTIIKKCEDIGDKIILFTQSLLSLDYIEELLNHTNDLHSDNKELSKYSSEFGWQFGIDYFRIDGSTDVHTRMRYSKAFNDPLNHRARLFLISTKAGGIGINLIGANRVVIFDSSWNPTHDVQSIFRSYRFGQVKPVFIYRLLSQGTMEEKIYQRQVNKQGLALRVCDEHQLDRHFTAADLNELYSFKPEIWNPSQPRPTPILPKDRLLADLLKTYPEWIVKYHEHDSLLENKIDEGLTEEERKAAWQEYEAEKNGVIPPQHISHTFSKSVSQEHLRYYQVRQMGPLGIDLNQDVIPCFPNQHCYTNPQNRRHFDHPNYYHPYRHYFPAASEQVVNGTNFLVTDVRAQQRY